MRWLWLCLSLLSLPIYGAEVTDHDYLGGQLQYLSVADGTLTAEDVIIHKLKDFLPGESPVLNFGFSKQHHWIKIPKKVLKQHSEGGASYLKIEFPLIKEVSVSYIRNGTVTTRYRTGTSYPFNSRPILDKDFVFPLRDELDYVLIRLYATNALIVPLRIINSVEYHRGNTLAAYGWGAFYGVLLLATLGSLLLFASLKDKTYFYYAAYIASMAMVGGVFNGQSFSLLWPNHPEINNLSIAVSTALLVIFATLFVRAYMETQTLSTKLDRCLKVVIGLAYLLIILSVFVPYDLSLGAAFLAVLFSLGIIWAGIMSWRAERSAAKYFCFAWIVFLSGIAGYALMVLKILPATQLTIHLKEMGCILDIILQSISLAERINHLTAETERALAEKIEALKEASRIKDEFLLTVGHELRTPINGIQGALDIIDQTEELDGHIRKQVTIGKMSTNRILELINDLLYQSEIKAGVITTEKTSFDLAELMSSINEYAEDQCGLKGLSYEYKTDICTPMYVSSDRKKIETILIKLLNNAIKFTERGAIRLKVYAELLETNQYSVSIYLSDTGIGIAIEKQKEIFTSFYQVDSSMKRNFQGIGTGLAIAKGFANCINGDITVDSLLGKGSTFNFRVRVDASTPPFESKNYDTINQQTDDELESLATKKILIVEDELTNQMIMKSYIAKIGCNQYLAKNGAIALQMCKENRFDLILMDCQMPVMDGLKATQAIRAFEAEQGLSQVPIIAVTANCLTSDKKKALASGMNNFLSKPIKFTTLKSTVLPYLCLRTSSADLSQTEVTSNIVSLQTGVEKRRQN